MRVQPAKKKKKKGVKPPAAPSAYGGGAVGAKKKSDARDRYNKRQAELSAVARAFQRQWRMCYGACGLPRVTGAVVTRSPARPPARTVYPAMRALVYRHRAAVVISAAYRRHVAYLCVFPPSRPPSRASLIYIKCIRAFGTWWVRCRRRAGTR